MIRDGCLPALPPWFMHIRAYTSGPVNGRKPAEIVTFPQLRDGFIHGFYRFAAPTGSLKKSHALLIPLVAYPLYVVYGFDRITHKRDKILMHPIIVSQFRMERTGKKRTLFGCNNLSIVFCKHIHIRSH